GVKPTPLFTFVEQLPDGLIDQTCVTCHAAWRERRRGEPANACVIWGIEFQQGQVESSLVRKVLASIDRADAEPSISQYLIAQAMARGAVVAQAGRQHWAAGPHLFVNLVAMCMRVRR